MNEFIYPILLTAVVALITGLLRFLPFWVFAKGTPRTVLYLGATLPYAIMGMLVVYCLKNINFTAAPFGAGEILAVLVVAVLHKWKHNTLLSILGGTVTYMFLVQAVFV